MSESLNTCVLQFGSVCSGIEAASVAWHPLGWRAAWFSEIDKAASEVLAFRFPDVPNLGDMTQLAGKVRRREIVAPDILVGGTPCQAFSIAGLRGGLADARGQLTLAFVLLADAIDEVRRADGLEPCIIVWENVPGVLNHKDNPFGCFIAGLAGEGDILKPPGKRWTNAGCVLGPERAIAWRTIDAQYFRLAQRRRRVFVVASAREGFDPAAILFEFDGVRRDSPPSRETGQGLTHPVAPCLTGSGRGVAGAGDPRGQDPVVTASRDDGLRRESESNSQGLRGGRVREPVGLAFGGNNTSGPIDVATARSAHGGPHGRLDFDSETFVVDVCPTLRAGGNATGGDRPPGTDVDTADSLIAVHGTQDPCVQNDQAFCLGRNSGQENVIAYAIQERAVCENPSAGPDGIGIRSDDIAYTMEARPVPRAVAYSDVLPFDTTQITHPLNRSSPAYGDPYHPLAVTAHPPAVCVTGDITHTLKAEGFDASEDGTGRGQPIVAIDIRNSKVEQDGPTMALQAGGISEGRGMCINAIPHTVTEMSVRRLVPVECERLQGFPDNWTLVPTGKKGKPAADGPRYKQCGNSMATHCMNWIGGRIANFLKTLVLIDDFDALIGHNGGPRLDAFEAMIG